MCFSSMAAPLNIAVAYLTPIWQTCQYVEGPSESYLKLVEPATLWWVTQKLAATTHCHWVGLPIYFKLFQQPDDWSTCISKVAPPLSYMVGLNSARTDPQLGQYSMVG